MKEVERKVMPANHTRVVDAARLLGMPMACVHTPADNCVTTFLQRLLDGKRPETLRDIIDLLEEIPEYRRAMENNAPPRILAGKEDRRAGRIFVDMTGGTEGSVKIFEKLAQAGVGTLVGMHFSAKHLDEAKKNNINIIVAGHIASDAIGINLILDAVCRKGKIRVTPCSGFVRVERKKR
jgi:putative NIF3 family GTP cyclohydrolase 1 type 2